jgi:hypothetical protein
MFNISQLSMNISSQHEKWLLDRRRERIVGIGVLFLFGSIARNFCELERPSIFWKPQDVDASKT